MNHKRLVKLSNAIGIVSIFLLLYWIFIFISIEVGELKIFRRNMTETFYMSIMGILALMAGSLIINVMLNLTRIADRRNADGTSTPGKGSKKWILLFLLSFPVIFGLLYLGDMLSARRKSQVLMNSAKEVIASNPETLKKLADYKYDREYFRRNMDCMDLVGGMSRNFVQNSARHYVEMEWKNSDVFGHSGKMHVLVYRDDGTLYKEVNEEVCDAARHKTTVRFDPKVDIGNFYVVLKDDYSNIWDRKNISVGVD